MKVGDVNDIYLNTMFPKYFFLIRNPRIKFVCTEGPLSIKADTITPYH